MKAKRVLSFFISIIILFSITVNLNFSVYALDYTGKCGNNVSYYFNNINGSLSIYGSGIMFEGDALGSSPFRGCNYIKSVNIMDGVVNVGYKAFENCNGIEEVNFSSTVKTIGMYAFYYCWHLKSVTFPYGVNTISSYSFSKCMNLNTVILNKSINKIGEGAFYNCKNISKVIFLGSVEEWNSIDIKDLNEDLISKVIIHPQHNYVVDETVNPTCSEDGYLIYKCHVCEDSYMEYKDDLRAIGHIYSFVDKSCDDLFYKCRNCDEFYSENIYKILYGWNNNIINRHVSSINYDRTSIYDINNDVIINAKDYALLLQLIN